VGARLQVEQLSAGGGAQGATRARPRAPVALEPRDVAGILDLGIAGLLARLGPILAVALLAFLPFGQAGELFGLANLRGFAEATSALAWSAVGLLPLGLTLAVSASLVGDALLAPATPLATGLARGFARTPGAIVLLFVSQVLALPLLLLCVAPYLVVQWLTWAALPIYVLEGEALLTPAERARAGKSFTAFVASHPRRLARALRKSVALSRGGAAFGRWAAVALVGQLVLGGVLELGASGLAHPDAREYLQNELAFGGGASEFALAALSALFVAVSTALRGALMVAFALDLRVRREGLDLERALAARGAAA
jgi:hypothetical protein